MNKSNKGISLVVLVITIIVIIILASITIVSVNDPINNGIISTFAEDVSKIKDEVELYYIQNSTFPIVDATVALTQAELLACTSGDKNASLQEELRLNGDIATGTNVGTYYKIDLAKINVESTSRGTLKNSNDVFVVSYPSMNVYYLDGIKVRKIWYFSLSSKITEVVKIPQNKQNDPSETSIQTVSGVTVQKATKLWTNKMGVSISANIATGETLYLSIAGSTKKQITTVTGNNSFSFDSLTDIISLKANIKIPTLVAADDQAFQALTQDKKYFDVIKEVNSKEVARIKVDMSNYDIQRPTVTSNAIITSKELNNIVSFDVVDILSGVKEVRYDYLIKYDSNAVLKNYYANITTIDDDYMKSQGKLASVSQDGHVELKVPKNIQKIQISVVDKAGNVSRTDTGVINTQIVQTAFYLGIEPVATTKSSIDFNVIINSANGIKDVVTSVSTDGVNYIQPQTKTINTANTTYVFPLYYLNIIGVNDKIYIKAVGTNNANTVETTVVAVDYKDTFVEEILCGGTRDKALATWNVPYVPPEFKYLESTVEDGYVIADKVHGNEFVWVPVKNPATDYKRGVKGKESDIKSSCTEDDTDPTNIAIKNSVDKYHGFYIGRYETGLNDRAVYGGTEIDGTFWKNATPVVKRGVRPWNNISQIKAIEVSKALINTENVKSTLINSYMWDTTLNYIISSNAKTQAAVITDSTSWGNYYNATFKTIESALYSTNWSDYTTVPTTDKQINTSWLLTTGATNSNSAKNIYDLAGNLWEWTTENVNSSIYASHRGGVCGSNGNHYTAAYRYEYGVENTGGRVGFRLALYLL